MEHEKYDEENADIESITSKFNRLSREGQIRLASRLVSELKKSHGVADQEILGKRELSIPIGIFENDVLSSLEAIVKYMKESLKLKFSKIAKLLNRSSKTIWATYSKAAKKMPPAFGQVSAEIMLPVSAVANRSFSTLESVVGFLKDFDYSNHEAALMMHLVDRTIWTVWDRVKKKRGMKAE